MAEEPLNVENHVKVLVESLPLPLRQVVSCAAVAFWCSPPSFSAAGDDDGGGGREVSCMRRGLPARRAEELWPGISYTQSRIIDG